MTLVTTLSLVLASLATTVEHTHLCMERLEGEDDEGGDDEVGRRWRGKEMKGKMMKEERDEGGGI